MFFIIRKTRDKKKRTHYTPEGKRREGEGVAEDGGCFGVREEKGEGKQTMSR
jgi:hypothetical protein